MAYKDMDKETSKWVLGGDGITNVRVPQKNLDYAKKLKKQASVVKKPKKKGE